MTILSASFVNLFNLSDTAILELARAAGVEIVQFGDRTFVYVAAIDDDGIAVFEMLPDGTLTALPDVEDSVALELDGAFRMTSCEISGTYFLIVAGQFDDGISVFSVDPVTGALANTDNISDAGGLELDGASAVSAVTVAGNTFVVVAGYNDNGLSIFGLDANGTLIPVQNISDIGTLELDGAYYVTDAMVDGVQLILVSGYADNGISVFSMEATGQLTPLFDLADDPSLQLAQPSDLEVVQIGGVTYLYVASQGEDAVSVFSVAASGQLTLLDTVTGPSLNGVHGLRTIDVDGLTLLAAAAQHTGTVTLFSVQPSGRLVEIAQVGDDATLNLLGTLSGDFVQTGDGLFYVASGFLDSGISVFEIAGGNDALVGDDGDNQLLGLGGDDTLTGLGGDDLLSGGGGGDLLSGGRGRNDLRGGTGVDTASYEEANGVRADLETGTAVARGYANDSLAEIENLTGSLRSDVLLGDNGDNRLRGLDGRDQLFGRNGNDEINGGSGADVLSGGAGDDLLTGGAGRDIFQFADTFGNDVVTDFAPRFERLDLRLVTAANSFADLTITQTGLDTLISLAGVDDTILLLNVEADDLQINDFWF